MRKIKKIIRKYLLILALTIVKVEKNALGQNGELLSSSSESEQQIKQNQLAQDLIQGRVTEEVILLRARLYKVIEATGELENLIKPTLNDKGEITGYDISKSSKKKPIHKKIKGDPFNFGKILMIINNEPITVSVLDTLESIGEYGVKQENSIIINRDIRPRFELEKYTTKLFIRELDVEDTDDKLLEFHIPKYSDCYNRKTNLLISDINKTKANPKNSDLIDIKSVGFITNKDIGVKDFLEFQYKINCFYGIYEFDGNFIIKFIASPMVKGENILEKYRNHKLDDKYNNKEFKGRL